MSARASSAPGLGHNRPPGPTPIIVTDTLADDLRVEWAHLYVRRDALLAAVAAWIEDHPRGVADDEDARLASDQLGQVLREVDVIDKSASAGIRAEVKRPIIEAGRIVDGIFKAELADQLRAAAERLRAPLAQFERQRQAAIRAEQERQRQEAARLAAEEQRLRQAEADRLAAEAARRPMDDAALARAIAAEEDALAAGSAPSPAFEPPPRETQRIYGDMGTVSHLATVWKAVIRDPAAVPRQYCTPSQSLIDAAMKASRVGKGPPTVSIPGVDFVEDTSLRTRR